MWTLAAFSEFLMFDLRVRTNTGSEKNILHQRHRRVSVNGPLGVKGVHQLPPLGVQARGSLFRFMDGSLHAL